MFVHCSPNPNVTRYKRTALTHAVMNGSASVASFLLRRGLDPDGADTSGNANLGRDSTDILGTSQTPPLLQRHMIS